MDPMHNKPDEFTLPPEDPAANTSPGWLGVVIVGGILFWIVVLIALVA